MKLVSGRSSGSSGARSSAADALAAARGSHPDGPERRLRTVFVGDGDYLPIYGGEAVRHDGAVIGRLRSVAYGPAVEQTIGYGGHLPSSIGEGTNLAVDAFDRQQSWLSWPLMSSWTPMANGCTASAPRCVGTTSQVSPEVTEHLSVEGLPRTAPVAGYRPMQRSAPRECRQGSSSAEPARTGV